MYHRTAEQRAGDFQRAKAFEAEVLAALPKGTLDNSGSTDRLDFEVDADWKYQLEVKEKRQPLTERWWLLDGVDERDLFVLDELTLRKLLLPAPYSYLLVRDVPGDRLFIANALEVACFERVRRNRVGKGKLIFNLQDFRRLAHLDRLDEFISADLFAGDWYRSECLGNREPGQI